MKNKNNECEICKLDDFIIHIFDFIKRGDCGDLKNSQDIIIDGEFTDKSSDVKYIYYDQSLLEKAENIFLFLCISDFNNIEYIIGLAIVKQLSKDFNSAINIYSLAFIKDKSDYRTLFYVGQCNLALGEKEKAKYCFEQVIEYIDNPIFRQKAEIYCDFLNDRHMLEGELYA